MEWVDSTHTQWAAGQGFFRTGRVRSGDVLIDYAYDCGSIGGSANCRDEIAICAGRTKGKPIDVMFLSHFHMDHVNCVPQLVEAVPVRRFVIPLVPPAERLLVLSQALEGPNPPVGGDWYLDLIADPVGALSSLGEGIDVVEVEPGVELPNSEISEADLDLDANETTWVPPGVGGLAALARDTPAGGMRNVWVWVPYVLMDASNRQRDFLIALAAELKEDSDSLDRQLNDSDYLRKIVTGHKAELIRAYRSVTKDLNLTSLCLYSGPTALYGRRGGPRSWRTRHGGFDRQEVAAWNMRPGWLGTGDAPLDSPARVQEVTTRFGQFLGNVGVLALPHHGSWRSLDPRLLDAFSDSSPTCVVSVGSPSRYHHPHTETVKAVSDRGLHLVCVTADPRSRWTSSVSSRI